jgi:very-short-patch-repair endonuclease
MSRRMRGTTRELEDAARKMRRAPTKAEAALWFALRRGHLGGYTFRRQHAVGRFVLDFYCAACKLVVEVDGGHHASGEQKEHDDARTAWLERCGHRVLRFTNAEVLESLPSVLSRIEQALIPIARRRRILDES